MSGVTDYSSVTARIIMSLFDLLFREINSALSKETDMFEKFMKRLDPKDMQAKGEQDE